MPHSKKKPTTTTTMLPLLLLLLLHPSLSLNQEGLYLLQAKQSLYDPNLSLSDWNPRDATPCNWTGVTCSPSPSAPTVTSVDLSNLGLSGPFPPVLCRLPNLSSLSLSLNYINSTLPPSSLLPCPSLARLDLSQNLLVGPLPSSLPSLPSLAYLDLSANNFTGPIPPSFATFPNLQTLSLVGNLLTSQLPSFLSNLTSLRHLNLSYNPFSPSPIPPSFSNLTSLHTLWLAGCNLVGPIPPSLGRLSSLTNLDVSANALTGSIPASLTRLRSAAQIELYANLLTGPVPAGFSNITTLRRIDFSMNNLSGALPDDIFLPPLLDSLHLYENNLSGPVPATAARAAVLAELRLFSNSLSGPLPAGFGRLSPLTFVDLSDNALSGEIPGSICHSGALGELLLLDNYFSGNVPESLGQCRSLTRVRLLNNRLSGEIPAGFWALPHVSLLELTGNEFSGSISPAISGAGNLSKLLISRNQFSGSIPKEMGALSNLYEFSAADNKLTGTLPQELSDLAELGQLDLHNNALGGEIPSGVVQSWKKLSQLNLAGNGFSGEIPAELGDLPVLNYLDLSGNSLTGGIPLKLQNLKLNQFNLSDNQLSGPLPPLFLTSTYRDSFLGNPGLCGDLSGLCSGTEDGSTDHHGLVWALRIIFVLSVLILVAGASLFIWRYWSLKRAKQRTDRAKWTLTSFHKLGFSEYEILDSLDEDNVIGSGASGKVYKVVLGSGEAVAVKKLWGSAKKDVECPDRNLYDDGFEAEVETLGKIRHKNIVKLWCFCSHKECKLLVYEYMPNGSLGDLLHSNKSGLLDWPTRYRIALDAAEGLSYLHHDCVPAIVHRDVKSNNILLDGEFRARVADFGVAKVIGKGPKSMSVIAGSCGYIAPEYAYTLRVNEKSDTYSFGVVILELVTGKLPVDPEFGEKDIVKWVCAALEQKGVDHVLDPKLGPSFREEMCKVLNIGLHCASALPINRPSMRRVVKMLLDVSPGDRSCSEKKNGKLTPYYYEDASSDQGSVV
ncbi:receptor-like protein kinase HSL1 [Iris pallida]|uniref:non-specific serine/threonine protein kinase n=1 Tax=Iris pallida TaxID=29817 RepID=A0AAX6GER5_IRIPA|nr:receptor-like protein kinase HSL1 [Iris pallida]